MKVTQEDLKISVNHTDKVGGLPASQYEVTQHIRPPSFRLVAGYRDFYWSDILTSLLIIYGPWKPTAKVNRDSMVVNLSLV